MDLLKEVINMNLLFFDNKFLILNKFFIFYFFYPRHHLWAILTPSFMFRQVATDTTFLNYFLADFSKK